MKSAGWFHACLLTILLTTNISFAQHIRRQLPFILGDEKTSLEVSSTHNNLFPTWTKGNSGLNGHTSRLESATLTSSLSGVQAIATSTGSSSITVPTTTTSSFPSSTSGVSPTSISGSDNLSDTKSWRVIGIAVICVTVVGILILSVTFYEQWIGFLRDVVCGRKKKESDFEEILTEKDDRDWTYGIRNGRMSNIRYPAQILSPPMTAQPLTRGASRSVRPSLLQRLSNHGRQFQQLPVSSPQGLGIMSPAGIHPRIQVGEVYPSTQSPAIAHGFAR